MSHVSPYSSILRVTATISITACKNNGMRAADSSGDTLGLQEKAPSRDMWYLVNITNKFYVATRNTYSYAYTLKQRRAEKRRHHKHP